MSDIGNKEVFATNLRSIMHEQQKDRNQVCFDLEFKYTTFADWYNGKKYPRIDKIEALANYFGVQKSDLIEEAGARTTQLPTNIHPMPDSYKVPRLGNIACGAPILATENHEDYDLIPDYIQCDFTLKCQGDSMINARIFDGDIVCIKQQQMVDSGAIAAVLVDNEEATLKRVELFDDHIVLRAENPSYMPLVFWHEEMNTVRIIGRATHFISSIR